MDLNLKRLPVLTLDPVHPIIMHRNKTKQAYFAQRIFPPSPARCLRAGRAAVNTRPQQCSQNKPSHNSSFKRTSNVTQLNVTSWCTIIRARCRQHLGCLAPYADLSYLNVVGSVVEKAEDDGQDLLGMVQDLGLAVLGELPQAEARALAHVGAWV